MRRNLFKRGNHIFSHRQLATELGRLNEELRREKLNWELRDTKMNESMQKWWSQIKERNYGDTLDSARAELDVMTQVNEARKQIFSSRDDHGTEKPKFSQTGGVSRSMEQDVKAFDEGFGLLGNEWAKRKEEMRKVREELSKAQNLKAEK